MTTRIVLILVPTVALAALGLCLFWRLWEVVRVLVEV